MFDHVTIRASDLATSERFYATVLAPLGIERTHQDAALVEWDDFSLAPADDYYGAFLLDPDGNSAEAVHHETPRGGVNIDHLWIRVADVAASKRFYATIAPHAGLELGADTPERVQFRAPSGSFSLVAGTPTEHVHRAFGASDDATVEAFHRTATKAGYRDNGAPGERPEYHPGYYGAYVLDPDGNNVEVVNHHR
jgi:catechol 2,3-dioxygenase-like lactoylglutathione lyase family enzyme